MLIFRKNFSFIKKKDKKNKKVTFFQFLILMRIAIRRMLKLEIRPQAFLV